MTVSNGRYKYMDLTDIISEKFASQGPLIHGYVPHFNCPALGSTEELLLPSNTLLSI